LFRKENDFDMTAGKKPQTNKLLQSLKTFNILKGVLF